jgi:hypothetical protein
MWEGPCVGGDIPNAPWGEVVKEWGKEESPLCELLRELLNECACDPP